MKLSSALLAGLDTKDCDKRLDFTWTVTKANSIATAASTSQIWNCVCDALP